MNLKSSFKKIACFLLAVLMLLSAVGCKDDASGKKKKVVVKKKVIVKNENDNNSVGNNNNNYNYDSNDGFSVVFPSGSNEVIETSNKKTLPERPLPEVAVSSEKYVETFVPEFDYEYKSLDITKDYVIVYSFEKWNNRKDSLNDINYTGFNRAAAIELQKFFKNNLNLNLEVKKDTEVGKTAKKILVGDTAFYQSKLGENEFAVKVKGDDLVFEGGHFAMVNKAVKWFKTVELKNGQVAVLNGAQDDFKSQVNLNGVTYDYVWGDEFDGNELMDTNKWQQNTFGLTRQDDLTSVLDDTKFQCVENGRLRLTADRYYDESDANIGYASHGLVTSEDLMYFRNGYVEVRARIPYARGAFPALWTASNMDDRKLKNLPNYDIDDGYGIYKNRLWTIEFDLMESFSDVDHMTTTVHKWYSSGVGNTEFGSQNPLSAEDVAKYNDIAVQYGYATLDKATNTWVDSNILSKDGSYYTIPVFLNRNDGKTINLIDYQRRPFQNLSSSTSTYQYSFTYGTKKQYWGNNKNGTYNWSYYFNPDTINKEYHVYAFQYTSTHCTVSIDGDVFLDFDWDPAFDYRDVNGDGKIEDISNNNNGVGFNLWHSFLFDMFMYTPNNEDIDADKKTQTGDTPYNLFVDWIRIYQDLDDASQAIYYPSGLAD